MFANGILIRNFLAWLNLKSRVVPDPAALAALALLPEMFRGGGDG